MPRAPAGLLLYRTCLVVRKVVTIVSGPRAFRLTTSVVTLELRLNTPTGLWHSVRGVRTVKKTTQGMWSAGMTVSSSGPRILPMSVPAIVRNRTLTLITRTMVGFVLATLLQ